MKFSPFVHRVMPGVILFTMGCFASVNLQTAELAQGPRATEAPLPQTADGLAGYIQGWSAQKGSMPSHRRNWERERFDGVTEEKSSHLQPACAEFLRRYPRDPRRWDVQFARLAFTRDGHNVPAQRFQAGMDEILAAPDASPDAKRHVRAYRDRDRLMAFLGDDLTAELPADLAKEFSAFAKDYPQDTDLTDALNARVQQSGDTLPEKLRRLLDFLAGSAADSALGHAARAALNLKTQPLDLKFTALDGREVDLATWRGKRVIVLFWASWSPPGPQNLALLSAAYHKLHGGTLEIVGVSLDKDRAAMEKFIHEKDMPWPEYFDGKGWDNAVAARFGISSVPRVWVVGPEGRINNSDATDTLADLLTRLMGPGTGPNAPFAPKSPSMPWTPPGASPTPVPAKPLVVPTSGRTTPAPEDVRGDASA